MFALCSLTPELASDVATTTETKPLVEVLNSRQLYSVNKLPPTSNFGLKPKWKISEDFVPPNDGKEKIRFIVTNRFT